MNEADTTFNVPLSERVNIEEYAKKISNNAINLFLSADQKDIAHVAFYQNETGKSIFITSIAIKKQYQGMGVGSFILESLKEYASQNDYRTIKLEADSRSPNLIRFYDKNQFTEYGRKEHMLSLRHDLVNLRTDDYS